MGNCFEVKKGKKLVFHEELKRIAFDVKSGFEIELTSKNIEKNKHENELNKISKLFPRQELQEKAEASQIVYLLNRMEIFRNLIYSAEIISNQAYQIYLNINDRDKLNSLNASFQYIIWMNNKIQNQSLVNFNKFLKVSKKFINIDIYYKDDLIPYNTKKHFEEKLPQDGLICQYLDNFYARNNLKNPFQK